ncbi:MAG: hypothetical protein FGF51_08645 [Candidatus Brockarchaeota archaeon]|nr:hypothetical protein [Candidatus Brockarchaeota archaeon]
MREKISIVGVFPTFFTTACKAVCNPAGLAGVSRIYEQLEEYPEEFVEDWKRVEGLVETLVSKGFKVSLVHAFTPAGLWFSLRYRLKQGFYVIVNNHPIKIGRDLDKIVSEIQAVSANHEKKKIGLGRCSHHRVASDVWKRVRARYR